MEIFYFIVQDAFLSTITPRSFLAPLQASHTRLDRLPEFSPHPYDIHRRNWSKTLQHSVATQIADANRPLIDRFEIIIRAIEHAFTI